jgi:hypothetical protein
MLAGDPFHEATSFGLGLTIENFLSARQSTRPWLLKNRFRRARLSGKIKVFAGMLRPWLKTPDAMLGHAA